MEFDSIWTDILKFAFVSPKEGYGMNPQIIPVNLGFVKSFLVKGGRTVVVDAGLKGSARRILRAMRANGINPGDVSLLLVTHAHTDHAGGLKELQEATGAPVAVHKLEAPCLSEGRSAPVALRSRAMKLLSVFLGERRYGAVRPEVTFDGKLDLAPYGVEGYVYPTPGHTAGSVTLVTAGGEAVVGDMAGGIAKPALPGVYEDLETLRASIAGLAGHAVTRAHTSHGRAFPAGDVLALGNKR